MSINHTNVTCPMCSYSMNMSTNLTDARSMISEGDLSICVKCGGVSQFRTSPKLTLVPLTREVYEKLPAETKHSLQYVAEQVALIRFKLEARYN